MSHPWVSILSRTTLVTFRQGVGGGAMRTILVVLIRQFRIPWSFRRKERMQEGWRGKWRERRDGRSRSLVCTSKQNERYWKNWSPVYLQLHILLKAVPTCIQNHPLWLYCWACSPLPDPVDSGQNKECFIPNINLFILWIKSFSFIQFTRLQ